LPSFGTRPIKWPLIAQLVMWIMDINCGWAWKAVTSKLVSQSLLRQVSSFCSSQLSWRLNWF
jgi:hypothetical protein